MELKQTIYELADQHKAMIFPGFTHLQSAQPVLLAHHLLAYYEMINRDHDRITALIKRVDICPLGSGAIAGNSMGLDRDFIAKELGFAALTQNSMDAVADRDIIIEYLSCVNMLMLHISRFCEEIVLWSSSLVNFVEIGDEFTTGSSLMPQKKNPDIAELIRGKTGRITGHLMNLSMLVKALPLTYNRDFQEDKEPLFDAVKTVRLSLKSFTKMISTLRFNETKIKEACDKGYLLATDLADYLVKKEIPFRQAHELTGQIVLYAIAKQKQLEELTIEEYKSFSNQIENDIFQSLTLDASINYKSSCGGTALAQVERQLTKIKEGLQ